MSKQSVLTALLMVVSIGLFSCVRERSIGCPEQAAVNKINIGYRVTRMPDKVAMRADLNDPQEDAIVRNVYLFIFHDNDLVRSRFFDTSASDAKSPQFAYSVSDKVLEKYKNNGYGRFSFYIIANVEKGDGNNDGASTVFHTISVNRLKEIRSKRALFSLVAESIAKSDLVSKKDASTGKIVTGFTATDMMGRYLKDLLMVGSIEDVDMDHLDVNNLPEGLSYSNGTMTVDVPLKRLVSKVTFKIKVDDAAFRKNEKLAEGSTLKFEPLEWQLYRAPRCATLFPGHKPTDETVAGTKTDNPIDKDDYYINSKPQNDFTLDEATEESVEEFSFYCLQNYKSPREEITANVYESRGLIFLREKQVKEDATDEDNKPYVLNKAFIYAPKNATYVRFTGHIVAVVKNGSKLKKDLVEVTYTVHLIDPEDNATLDPNNYNIEGNCNYTYNITIEGYNDLKVEVKKGQGKFNDNKKLEENPGAEGNYYSDIQSFYVDAHYSKVLLKVYKSISETESEQPFFVNTPFDYPERDKKTGGRIDVNWVHFMPVPKQYATPKSDGRLPYDHVPLYPGDDIVKAEKAKPAAPADILKKRTLTVDELRPYMTEFFKHPNDPKYADYVQEDGGQKFIVFVAFIDEYYYDENPIDHTPITDRNTFVNARPRKMWIRTATPQLSFDRKTSQVASAIEIDQVAIQSIYDPASLRAVGAEVYDESYGTFTTTTNDTKFEATIDGRYTAYGENGGYTPETGSYIGGDGKNFEYRGLLTSCIAWGLLPRDAAEPSKTFQQILDTNPWTKRPWSECLMEYNNNGAKPSEMNLEKSFSICQAPDNKLGGWYGTIKTLYDTTYSNYDDETGEAAHLTYLNCLSRNRDNNGNGVIDPEEVKWVMPTLSAIEDMQVSRFSFQRAEYRLFASDLYMSRLRESIKNKYPGATISSSIIPNTDRPYLFTLTSSYIPFPYADPGADFLWTHEGLSVATMGVMSSWGDQASKWNRRAQTRCVRILGDNKLSMKNPYNFDTESRVVELLGQTGNLRDTRFPPTAYRNTETTPVLGFLPPHSVFDKVNIPAMRFQIAKADVSGWYDKNYPSFRKACENYAEKSDRSDEGEWRLPNASELHYMQLAVPDIFQKKSSSHWASCTLYSTSDVAVLVNDPKNTGNFNILMSAGRGQTKAHCTQVTNLRCIRDLKSNETP